MLSKNSVVYSLAVFYTFLATLVYAPNASSQEPYAAWSDSSSCCVIYSRPLSVQYFITPEMPKEIRRIFQFVDSICHVSSQKGNSQKLSSWSTDSLLTLLRKCYRLYRYNPVLITQHGLEMRRDGLEKNIEVLMHIISGILYRRSKPTELFRVLVGSQYILHARVIAFPQHWQEHVGDNITRHCAGFLVLDNLLEGQVDYHKNAGEVRAASISAAQSLKRRDTIRFSWTSETDMQGKSISDEIHGGPLIEHQKEYIVFGYINSPDPYNQLASTYQWNRSLGMNPWDDDPETQGGGCWQDFSHRHIRPRALTIPIENGSVLDSMEYFQMGKRIPLKRFKDFIRNGIEAFLREQKKK